MSLDVVERRDKIALTEDAWRADYDAVSKRLDAWMIEQPDGSRAVDVDLTPGPLMRRFADLVEAGHEHGWLPA